MGADPGSQLANGRSGRASASNVFLSLAFSGDSFYMTTPEAHFSPKLAKNKRGKKVELKLAAGRRPRYLLHPIFSLKMRLLVCQAT